MNARDGQSYPSVGHVCFSFVMRLAVELLAEDNPARLADSPGPGRSLEYPGTTAKQFESLI
jgi:hypothetical protein